MFNGDGIESYQFSQLNFKLFIRGFLTQKPTRIYYGGGVQIPVSLRFDAVYASSFTEKQNPFPYSVFLSTGLNYRKLDAEGYFGLAGISKQTGFYYFGVNLRYALIRL